MKNVSSLNWRSKLTKNSVQFYLEVIPVLIYSSNRLYRVRDVSLVKYATPPEIPTHYRE